MSQVWEVDLPDSEKIVLLALADCANDEGRCWPSMATLAKKCSKSDRTCQAAIKALVKSGHITRNEIAGKGCNYTIHPRSYCTPEAASPPKGTTQTPEAASDKPSRTIIRKEKERARPLHEMPTDWQPMAFGVGTHCRNIVDGWPPGGMDRQLEHFRAHHGKKGDKFKDWQKAWATWVLNSEKFGNGQQTRGLQRNAPPPANPLLAAAIRRYGNRDSPDGGLDFGSAVTPTGGH